MVCPLFVEFEKQFVFGDYVTGRQRQCRILQRMDEVAVISQWNIDVAENKMRMLMEIKPAYDVFRAYIDECHPHLKTVGRHGTCYATLEWHSLNMYLVVNGVTTEAVARYIAADKLDRSLFHAARMTGEFVYFSKCPQKINETLYLQSAAPRYATEGVPALPPVMLPPALPPPALQEAIPDFADPLMSMMNEQMIFGHYASDTVQMRLRSLERIDEIAGDACIDELPDRLAFANKLAPLYHEFDSYLLKELPEVFEEGRNGVVIASIEWHSLHQYLVEYGFTADAVAQYIAEDRRDRTKFHENRCSGHHIYYGKCLKKLDPAKYPRSIKRYAV